jgi:large subunit ribosomal protein L49
MRVRLPNRGNGGSVAVLCHRLSLLTVSPFLSSMLPLSTFSTTSRPAFSQRRSHPPPFPPSFVDADATASAPSSSSSRDGAAAPLAVQRRSKKTFNLRPLTVRKPLPYQFNPMRPLRPLPVTPPPRPSSATASSSPAIRTVPFSISRTPSLQLPVYLSLRAGGTLPLTIVRRINGDAGAFARELEIFIGDKAEVRLRPGRVEVKGNYREAVVRWITNMGF